MVAVVIWVTAFLTNGALLVDVMWRGFGDRASAVAVRAVSLVFAAAAAAAAADFFVYGPLLAGVFAVATVAVYCLAAVLVSRHLDRQEADPSRQLQPPWK